ncbi:MAG: DUF3618 domain-containing protein [Propionibacteriaceae bacterium]|jgi:hypothetical protein|nr:DUF3618 domain-containing protein [Propionibacteriaceae bacterium]
MAERQRTTQEIEAEIAAARERLASGLDSLINQVHPKAVAQRTIAGARERAEAGVGAAKAAFEERVVPLKDEFVDGEGGWRTDRVALVAGLLAVVVIVATVIARLRKK